MEHSWILKLFVFLIQQLSIEGSKIDDGVKGQINNPDKSHEI